MESLIRFSRSMFWVDAKLLNLFLTLNWYFIRFFCIYPLIYFFYFLTIDTFLTIGGTRHFTRGHRSENVDKLNMSVDNSDKMQFLFFTSARFLHERGQ